MCFLGRRTQIPSDMCFPVWETHIPSDKCSPTRETHILSDMCSLTWETHVTRDMCFLGKGTQIPSDMCSPTLTGSGQLSSLRQLMVLYSGYWSDWSIMSRCYWSPLNRSQQLPAQYKRLIDEVRSSKTNYERTTGELTIWLTIDDCLTVTIDGSKCTNYWLRVFIANNITA